MRRRPSFLLRETSSSQSREGAGSSRYRVPLLFSALAVAPDHGTEVKVLQDAGTLAGSSVPDTLVLPAGSATTLILVEDKERAAESMPPPLVRKDIYLALRAPSAVPVSQPKGRKRKFTKGGDGESS